MNTLEADAIKQCTAQLTTTCADINDTIKKVHAHLQRLDAKVNRIVSVTNDIRRAIMGGPTTSSSSVVASFPSPSQAVTFAPFDPSHHTPTMNGTQFPPDLITAKKLDAPSFYVRWDD